MATPGGFKGATIAGEAAPCTCSCMHKPKAKDDPTLRLHCGSPMLVQPAALAINNTFLTAFFALMSPQLAQWPTWASGHVGPTLPTWPRGHVGPVAPWGHIVTHMAIK